MEDIILARTPDKDLRKLSIYRSSAGLCLKHRTFGFRPNPEDIRSGDRFIDHAVVPKLKKKYAKSGKYLQPVWISDKGHNISPDELLTMAWRFNPSELPYMTKDEVKKYTGQSLPDSELLKCLHYYISDRVSKSSVLQESEGAELEKEDFYRFMDESALLALGKTVETWIDKIVEDKDDWKSYMEMEEQKLNDNESALESSIDQDAEGETSNEEQDTSESSYSDSESSYKSATE